MGLKVWLPLDGNLENQGASAYQAVGTDLTVDNSGKIGKCYSFNGTSSKITIANFSIGNNWSYGAWIYSPTSSRSWEGAIILNNNGGDTDMQLGFYTYPTGNKIQSTANGQYNSSIPMTYGQWNHLFATFDGSSLKTYINGVLVNTKAITNSQLARVNLTIGARCRGSSYDCFFSGKINDVRIYDHCLSALEIKKISQCLVLHYKLNSGGTLCKTDLASWSKEGGVTSATQSDGSVKIDCTAKTSSRYGIYCDIQNVLPNTAYTFTVECKTANSTKPFQLSVGTNPVPSGTSQFGTSHATMNSPNGFTQYTATVVTKTDTTWIRFYLACSCNSTNPEYQYAFVKNVNMTMGSTINSIIYDSSGYNHNGTIIGNMAIQAESPRYSSCSFMNNTGTSNHIEMNENFLFTNPISVSFWVKSALNINQALFASPQIQFGTLNSLGYVNPASAAGFAISTLYKTNQWNHICVIRDNTNYSLYVNGEIAEQNGANNYYAHNKNQLWILNRSYNNAYPGNASMSDFRIYCIALSAEDVKKLYETSMEIDSNGNILPRALEQ